MYVSGMLHTIMKHQLSFVVDQCYNTKSQVQAPGKVQEDVSLGSFGTTNIIK